jgi:hypothetical protein
MHDVPPMTALLRTPSAWLPMVMSLAALVLIAGVVAFVGVTDPGTRDEGPAARIFQLLMLAQAALIVLFAVRWVPVAPRPAIAIVALQSLLAAIPLATIAILEA